MIMSVRKCKHKASLHAVKRLKQRGWEGDPEIASVQARRYGVRAGDLGAIVPTPALYHFLRAKEDQDDKVAVAYHGWVWVYSRNSDRLITAYEMPEWLKIDYDGKFKCIEEWKRKAWKKQRRERRSGTPRKNG